MAPTESRGERPRHAQELKAKLRPLAGKVAASIADQTTSSGTNFVMNVLLARWLSRTDYGAFSVCWSFCLIFAAFHNALILEPMTIVGPAEHGSQLPGYLQIVRRLNWFVVAALGLFAAGIGLFYRQADVRVALATLGLALPGYLLLLTVRRRQYVVNEPARAFHISLAYALTLGITLAILRKLGWLSAASGVVCIGMALPIALLAQARAKRPPAAGSSEGASLASVSREHWRYGKWLFASAVLAVGVPDLQTILLSALVDLKAAGALRALMNFILPLSQIATVLSIYALPGLARKMKTFGAGLGLRQAIVFPVAIILLAVVYLGLLVVCGSMLEKLLYNGRMSQYLVYLPLLALAALISAIGAGFTTLLRAAQNSQHQLFAGIAATVVGVIAAMLLLQRYGLEGAMVSMILANTASTLWIVATYWYMVHKCPASWSAAWAGFYSQHSTDGKLSTAAASE